jgi:hypothetical protein
VFRVLLAVALAVALLAVAVPAIEQAGVQRSDGTARAAADELASEMRALLADSDAVAADVAGARRVVELDLPERGFASAGLATFRVERARNLSRGTRGARIVWRVAGGTRHVRRIPDVGVRTTTDRTVAFETGGTRTLVLELVRLHGRRVVRLHRRGFK